MDYDDKNDLFLVLFTTFIVSMVYLLVITATLYCLTESWLKENDFWIFTTKEVVFFWNFLITFTILMFILVVFYCICILIEKIRDYIDMKEYTKETINEMSEKIDKLEKVLQKYERN